MKSNALLIIILIIIVAIVGIYFGYNMFFNKPNLTNSSTNITSSNNYQNLTTHTIISSNTTSANNYQNTSNNYLNNYSNYSSYINIGYNQYIPITIYNTQNIPAPSPFQQQIAICNGTINIGPNFAYVNNPTLFNLINRNGSNVYFTTTCNSTPDIYSWYLGQLVNRSTYCKIWWIKLDNGIPANSNVTIYMYIGDNSSNFYQQYYPYVGASPNVFPSRQYDNGKYVFIAYGYFNNTFDGWTGYVYAGLGSPTATPYGIEMLADQTYQGRYILPPNNWNIPLIPLIVEEAWYHTKGADANVIALFGNMSQQLLAGTIGSTYGGATPAPNLSTFVQFEYYYGSDPPDSKAAMLKSAVTNQYLYYVYFSPYGRTVYSYLIVNSTYAEAGYYIYSYYGYAWIPLTLLNTYKINWDGYVWSDLNYNPFQYGTLQISAGTSGAYSYQYVQWVIARAYPPNGAMPSIYID
ncbi:MAG: hypothetical protein ACO2ON_03535 [Candidatus Nanopusillus sp.]